MPVAKFDINQLLPHQKIAIFNIYLKPQHGLIF